jgi:hypothetical protein
MIYLCKSSLEDFSFLAIAILQETTLNMNSNWPKSRMKLNINQHMLQQHLSKDFLQIILAIFVCYRIPEEHREKIFEWLKNDFQMRIDGKITRSRCLFMVGPTQHGI